MEKQIIIMICLSMAVAANIQIESVLYDPIATESGGEAILLKNYGEKAIDISSWTIGTDNTLKDAVIPDNTVILSGSTYLITDSGWDENKDNLEWKSADHEEAITMKNSDSGVILFDANNEIVDAVGWGTPTNQSFFKGTPTHGADSGHALVRVNLTGNNHLDFVNKTFLEQEQGSNTLNLKIQVQASYHNIDRIEIDDDFSEEGIQISPIPGENRQVQVDVYVNSTMNSTVTAEFNSFLYELVKTGNKYSTIIEIPYSMIADTYEMKITSENDISTLDQYIDIEIKEIIGLKINNNDFDFGVKQAGTKSTLSTSIENIGNTDLGLSVLANVLDSGSYQITPDYLKFISETAKQLGFEPVLAGTLAIEQIKNFGIEIFVPIHALSGIYQGSIEIIGLAQ